MTPRRFFATIWRINAIMLFVMSALAIIVLVIVATMFISDMTRSRHTNDVARLVVGSELVGKARLGSFESIPNSTVIRAPLSVRQPSSSGLVSKDGSSERNYLYYEPNTRVTRWLKPSMDSIIIQKYDVQKDEGTENRYTETRNNKWVANVFTIVASDTNGDGALSSADQMQITASKPDGTEYRVLVEKAGHVNEVSLLAPDRALVLYSLGEKLLAVEFNPQLSDSPPQHYEVKLPTAEKK